MKIPDIGSYFDIVLRYADDFFEKKYFYLFLGLIGIIGIWALIVVLTKW